ncbi:MAG: glycosyltransferase family 39 protein [Burkholderiales bacterium]|nr:glycosyltransferase family 39 protein [Burkholderiales bacterium]
MRGVLLLLGLLTVARLAGMDLLPLMDTTEARYAEIGRKMAELGDWITPWYPDGLPFWGKPPLSFWFTAASFKVFGVNEFAARLPHFLCAAGVVALTWRLAAHRGREEALLAGALLGGSTLFYVSSGAVMTDGALLLGTTLAMYGFWAGLHGAQAPRQRERWWLFVGIAIGLLAKGPVALVLIGAPLLAWTLMRAEAGAAWRAFPWVPGLALIAVLVAPWYTLAEVRTPGFLDYFLVGEHWHRFVTPGWQGDLYGNAHRYAPGTIWIFAVGALLPWSVLLPVLAVIRRWKGQASDPAHQDRAWTLYLLAWGLTPLLFFTAARNVIWTYVLPGLPAFSLLGAHWLMKTPPATRQRLVAGGLLVSLVAAVVFAVHLEWSGGTERKSAKALVAAYTVSAVRGPEGQPLIYIGARPHSAVFYSAGQARRLDNVAQLADVLPVQGAYVAIRSEDLTTLQTLPATGVDPSGRFGSYELVRLTPAGSLPSMADDPAAGMIGTSWMRPSKLSATLPATLADPSGTIGVTR